MRPIAAAGPRQALVSSTYAAYPTKFLSGSQRLRRGIPWRLVPVLRPDVTGYVLLRGHARHGAARHCNECGRCPGAFSRPGPDCCVAWQPGRSRACHRRLHPAGPRGASRSPVELPRQTAAGELHLHRLFSGLPNDHPGAAKGGFGRAGGLRRRPVQCDQHRFQPAGRLAAGAQILCRPVRHQLAQLGISQPACCRRAGSGARLRLRLRRHRGGFRPPAAGQRG